MIKSEVLAPAGGMDSVYAAVRSGADAVYLGGKALNARRNAQNFSDDELEEAIRYCHAGGVKVYITLNTLVSDSEMKTAEEEIRCACRLSADALILQDIGLAETVRRIAPDMPMHASTQMSVQSINGVRLLEKAGFSRVVLARELSYDEIKEIAEEAEAELEIFVHGALCMSVSGQCLLSAVLGSRSGNRGLCAQPCRLPFGVDSKPGHALSLKDMSIIEHLPELEKAGIRSFKIEGRMKRPEYVAASVTACRKSLAGEMTDEISSQLRSVFSRSGFTKGYFEGRLGLDMFGTRNKEDVESAAPVLKGLQQLYSKEKARIPVDFALTCIDGETITLSGSACGKSAFVDSGFVPEKALNRPLDEDGLKERIAKCGGTRFYADEIYIELDVGLSAPASVFNAIRREVLEKLEDSLAAHPQKSIKEQDFDILPHKAGEREIHIRVACEKQIPKNLHGISRVILPINASAAAIGEIRNQGCEAAVEIPRAFFSNSDKFRRYLTEAKANGADLAVASTLDGLELALESDLPVSAGFGMNIFNSRSVSVLENLGVRDVLASCELTLRQIASLGGSIPRGILAYGRLPLMLTRNCPVRTAKDCKDCRGNSSLTDRMGISFPVRCSFGCSEVLNSRVLQLTERLGEIKNCDYILLYFTDESPEETQEVIAAHLEGKPLEGEYTRGLYYRGVE